MSDKLIVILYLFIILFIGVYYRAKSHSLKGLSVVSNKGRNNKWLLVATIFTTSIGGGTIFGISEKSCCDSMAWTYGMILTIPIDIIIACYLVPKLVKNYGAISIGDIICKHYGYIGRMITGISVTITSLGYLASQIRVSGYIFESILGIKHSEGLILSYIIVIIYTAAGGLRSIVATHFLQFFAMLATIPVMTLFGMHKIGFNNFLSAIPSSKYSLTNPILFYSMLKIALSFSVMGFSPTFIQRALISENPAETKQAVIIKSVFYTLFLLCIGIIGLLASYFLPTQPPAFAISGMIDLFFPPIIRGIMVIGLLAAVISTADANLNITSISIVNDLIKPLIPTEGRTMLYLLMQFITIAVGSISIYIALNFESVLDLVIFVTGFWSSTILVPIIFGLFNIRVSVQGFIISSIIGLISFMLWEYLGLTKSIGVAGVFIGTISNLLIFIILKLYSRFTQSINNIT